MRWLFQQAKTVVQGSKRKEQLHDKPQDSREDVTTVASGAIRKKIAEDG